MTEKTDSTEMAQDRTDWAEDRTILANERTFAGWMRTGMACIAIAVGLKAIFGEAESGFYPARLAATLFIGIALYIFWAARSKAIETVTRLSDHEAHPLAVRSVTIVAGLLALGGATTGVLLWMV